MIAFPAGLWYLLILVPALVILWQRYLSGSRDLRALGGAWRSERLRSVYVVKSFFSGLTFVFFCVFTILALSGISWGRYPVSDRYLGSDVAIAIDVSRSMLAQDVYPSRLSRTAGVIQGLLDRAKRSRFSVVVFKGIGVQVIPLTEDTDVISSFLRSIGPGVLSSPGTDIEKGIDAALDSLALRDADKKMILLFTDGGALSGTAEAAARRAAARSIPVYAIAAGSAAGAPIPLGEGKFVVDRNGDRVISRVNDSLLERIASTSGGEMLPLDDPLLLTKLTAIVNRPGGGAGDVEFRFEPRDQYRSFLALALLCLAMFVGVRVVRWRDTF